MQLIIVESPTKARTLSKYLGKGYQVEATMGHIRDLPKSEIGVDVEDNFTPRYVIPKDKQKRVGELKAIAAKADEVILATDPDREGEAIAWHIASILANKNHKSQPQTTNHEPLTNYKRIVFHEITESAIKSALDHPQSIDFKLVDAQQARRVLDRLVGYKLSPLLWKKLSRKWLSAGRVQSVVVRLIVEREREIQKFTKIEYWTLTGTFIAPNLTNLSNTSNLSNTQIAASLVSKDGIKYEQTLAFDLFDGKYTTTKTTISSQSMVDAITKDLLSSYTVSAVDKKEITRAPAAPYTTSTLQQDAGRRLGFSAKKTMQVAQRLYEEGHITYHRTDSVNLADKFIADAHKYLSVEYGAAYLPDQPRRFQTKSKVAQEAHEAIRPTNVNQSNLSNPTNSSNSDLNRDHLRLYELIWKRALASQTASAVFDSTTVIISSANGYVFSTQGSVIKFDGYLKITGRDAQDQILPPVAVGDTLDLSTTLPQQHFTSPPPRYTEASLVKTLEEKDIGRPSTYAPIITTIQDRQYVTREEKKLLPTELGELVVDFLVQYFPKVMELPFTAHLEADLDAIANGEKSWQPVIREFYVPFAADLAKTYDQAEKVKLDEEILAEKCPQCQSPLVIRTGKFGKFIACTAFPKCDYTKQLVEKIDKLCPRCGGDIVVKKTRRGKSFYGCSNYPKCTFAAWKKEDIR